MTIIGSAYVDIRAITDHLESDIKRVLATLPDKIEINVDANTKAAEDQIDLLVAWADLHKVDITVNADTSVAESEIEAAAHDADVKINVDADTAAAKVHMDAFIAEEDVRHINVPVDVEDAVARTKIGSMFDTLTKISNFKPFALFDSSAIEEAKKKAEALGEEFKAPYLYNLSTKAAEDSLNHLKTSASNVDKFLKLLSGAPQLMELAQAAIAAKVNLGEHAITVAMVAERYAAMASGALYAAGNILSLGSSVVQLTGLFAALPGVFVGFEIASKITSLAFSDMKKAVPDLQKEFQHLKDTIAQNFWSTARQGFEDLFIRSHTLGDQLDITAKAVGGFWGAMTEGMSKGSFAKAMIGDFANLDNGIKTITASSGTFLHIFQTLGEFGSAYIPKLAKGFDDVSARFDAFLTKANSDGTLKRWVDNGIESFKGLMSAVINTSAVINGLMRAAVDAGGASLGVFGAAMEKLAAVINKPEVQANLVNLFSGANAAIAAVTQGLGAFMGAIGFLSPALKVVLTDAGRAIQIFLDIIAGVLTNVEVYKGLQDMFTGIVTGLGAFADIITPLGNKLGTLFTIVGMVADSLGHVFAFAIAAVLPVVQQLLSGIEPLIYPLGEITTAIVNTLVPALKILVDVAFPPLIQLMVTAVLPAFQQLVPILGTALPPLISAIASLISDLTPIFTQLIQALLPVISNLLTIGVNVIPVVMSVINPLRESLVKLLEALIPIVVPILNMVAGFLSMNGAGPVLVGILSAVVLGIGAFNAAIGITKFVTGAAEAAVAAFGTVSEVMGGLVGLASGEVDAMVAAATALEVVLDALGIGLIILAIVGLVAVIILLVTHWNEVTKAVGDFIGTVGKNLGDFFKSTGSMFVDFFNNTVGMFKDFFSNSIGMFKDFFNNLVSAYIAFGKMALATLIGFFNNTVGMFKDFFNNTVGMVTDWGTRTIGMFKDFGTNTFGMFSDFFKNTIGMFKDFFDSVIKGFQGFAKDPIGEVKKFVSSIDKAITDWAVSVLVNITKCFTDINNAVRKWVLDAVLAFTKFVQDSVLAFVKFGVDAYLAFNKFVKDTEQAILNWAASILAAITKFNTNTMGMIIDWVHNTIGMFQDFARQAPQAVLNFAASVIAAIVRFNTNTLGMIIDWVKNTVGMFKDFAKNAPQAIIDFAASVLTTIAKWNKDSFGMVIDFVKNTIGMIQDFGKNLENAFIDLCNSIVTSLASWFAGLVGMFVDYYNSTTGDTHDFLTTTFGMFRDFFTNTIGMFTDFFNNTLGMFRDMWTNIANAVVNGIANVVHFFSSMGQTIMNAIGDPGAILADAGNHIMSGFLKGLTDGFDAVKNFVGGIGDWIAQHKGPEAYDRALLIPHGGWIIGGLQKGIEDSMGGLKNTLTGVTDLVSSAVSANIAVNVGNGMSPGNPNPNPNVFARTPSSAVDMFAAAASMQRGNGMVTTPTVNVYPSAPLNEEQVGRMAATEMYWQLLNH